MKLFLSETHLVEISKISNSLANIDNLQQIDDIQRKASVLKTYFSGIKGKEIQVNEAHKIELEAQRRGGEILLQMKANGTFMHGGDRKSKSNDLTLISLEQLGLSRNDSSYWQILAKIPADEWKQVIENIDNIRRTGNTLAVKRFFPHQKVTRDPMVEITPNENEIPEAAFKSESVVKVECPKCRKKGIPYTQYHKEGRPEFYILHDDKNKCDLGKLYTMREAMQPFLKPETVQDYQEIIEELIEAIKQKRKDGLHLNKTELISIFKKHGLWNE